MFYIMREKTNSQDVKPTHEIIGNKFQIALHTSTIYNRRVMKVTSPYS